MSTLLDVIDNAVKSGSESWNAPHCPNCGRGDDRLVIWPNSGETGQVYCRKCDWGRSAHPDGPVDGIEYLRNVKDMTFQEACKFFGVEGKITGNGHPDSHSRSRPPSTGAMAGRNDTEQSNEGHSWQEYSPPNDKWRASAAKFAKECKDRLRLGSSPEQSALSYLMQRGLNKETIDCTGLGVNPRSRYPKRTEWGLAPREDRPDGGKIWLPRGIVIPWADQVGVSNISIRRPNGDVEPNADAQWKRRKYQQAAGPWSPLWGVQWVRDAKPVVLVEGEFDAIAIQQEAADLCAPVATGSTGGARRRQWFDLLSKVPAVLVSFDSDEAGERAARVWTAALPNSFRWHPHDKDPSDMLKHGHDLRMWVRCGLRAASFIM